MCDEGGCERDLLKEKWAIDKGLSVVRVLQEDVWYDRVGWKEHVTESITKARTRPPNVYVPYYAREYTHRESDALPRRIEGRADFRYAQCTCARLGKPSLPTDRSCFFVCVLSSYFPRASRLVCWRDPRFCAHSFRHVLAFVVRGTYTVGRFALTFLTPFTSARTNGVGETAWWDVTILPSLQLHRG